MKKFLVFILMLSMIWLSSCSLNAEEPSTNTDTSEMKTTDNSSITTIESTREDTDTNTLSTVFVKPELDMSLVAEAYRLNLIEYSYGDKYIEIDGNKYYELNSSFTYNNLDDYKVILENVFPKDMVEGRLKSFVVKDDKIYRFKPTKNIYEIFYQETYDFDNATYYYENSDDKCDNFMVKVPVEGKDKIQIIYVNIQKSSGKIDGFTFMKNEHMGE